MAAGRDHRRGRHRRAPSALSLLGLVRHMAEVERNWFRPLLAGEDMVGIYAPGLDAEVAFGDVASADVAESFRTWQAECDHARALTAAAPSLDITGERGGERFTLRWVITHMIEEYARHNGRADLLRERIDGRTGEQRGPVWAARALTAPSRGRPRSGCTRRQSRRGDGPRGGRRWGRPRGRRGPGRRRPRWPRYGARSLTRIVATRSRYGAVLPDSSRNGPTQASSTSRKENRRRSVTPARA